MKQVANNKHSLMVANSKWHELSKECPIFFFTFILLNPFILSIFRGEKFSALRYFFMINTDGRDVITCDLYFVIFVSFIMMAISALNIPIYFKWILKSLWYSVLTFSFVIRKFLLLEFGMDFSPTIFSLISETNPTESKGFLDTFVFSAIGMRYLSMFILVIISIIAAEMLWKRVLSYFHRFNLNSKVLHLCSCIVCFVLMIMIGINLMNLKPLMGYSGQNTIIGLYSAYNSYSKDKLSSHRFLTDMVSYDKSPIKNINNDSLNIVFVIGESFIKSHAQIYGYPLPTTPYLQKEYDSGNLYIFQDLISLFSKTTPSLQNAFCLNVLNGGGQMAKWYESCYWPLLMKKAGYNVYMWDNQKDGDKKFQGSFHEMYAPSVAKLCYTKTNAECSQWDEFIVKDFAKQNRQLSDCNFIYFHLQGQHNPFDNKYPKNKAKFSKKDYPFRKEKWITPDKLQTISDYDNSILYNDYVLHLVFDKFKNTNAIVIFVSDHGEEVYDYRDKQGRTAMDENMKSQFAHSQHDIPFVVWVSDKLKQQNSALCEQIASSVLRPYSLDRIGHFILNLAGIMTKYYSAEDDVINKQFKKKDRFIYLSGQNRTLNYEAIK